MHINRLLIGFLSAIWQTTIAMNRLVCATVSKVQKSQWIWTLSGDSLNPTESLPSRRWVTIAVWSTPIFTQHTFCLSHRRCWIRSGFIARTWPDLTINVWGVILVEALLLRLEHVTSPVFLVDESYLSYIHKPRWKHDASFHRVRETG